LRDATDARRRRGHDLGFGDERGHLLGGRRLGRLGGFGGLRGLFGLDLATKTVGVGPTSDPVRLGVLYGRGGARGAYAEFLGERE
jgi:hypothetical protein